MRKTKKQKLIPFFVYLTKEQKEFLVDLADLEVKTMSSIVREALNLYFYKIVEEEYGSPKYNSNSKRTL